MNDGLRSLVLLAIGIAISFAPSPGYAMSEDELCNLYLGVVEDAVEFYEPIWVDVSNEIPRSGYFDFRRYGNWIDEPYATIIMVPGNGMVAFCYAVLLKETDKQHFSQNNIPRDRLLEHAVKAIRWCCLTSTYVDNPYPYLPNTRPEFLVGENWRRVMSYRADEVGWLTMAAAKLWDDLDLETRELVEAVLVGGAAKERLVQEWDKPQGGNHDQVKQDLSSTMGAAFMFPNRADKEQYMEAVRGNGIDMVSTLHDFASTALADGRSVNEWAQAWNLYQDYSSDHHGWCNIWYGGDLIFEGRSYVELLSAMTGIPVPETYSYPGNGFDGVLSWMKTVCQPQGEPASIHGNEYDTNYGAGLLGYCYGALLKNDPVAATLERGAALLLRKQSRAIRQYDYHRNSWAKAATAYLLHKHRGPGAEPLAWEEAWARLQGTWHYPWQQNLIHRAEEKWVSFTWGSISSGDLYGRGVDTGLCGLVIPTEKTTGEPRPLIYNHTNSLTGSFSIQAEKEPPKGANSETNYSHTRNDRGFHTAGLMEDFFLKRYYAFYTFGDGPCVLLTKVNASQEIELSWSGMPVYFFERKNYTEPRRLFAAEGVRTLEEPSKQNSSWWSVDNRIGLVSWGGNGKLEVERLRGKNWARQPEYRDECVGVFVSPLEETTLQAGETACQIGALIYPHASERDLSRIATDGNRDLDLPEGWTGTFAPDLKTGGARYLAVANFDGSETYASLSLHTDRGAPVFSRPTRIRQNKGRMDLRLNPLESFGECCEMLLETTDGGVLQARRMPNGLYTVQPLNRREMTVWVRPLDPKAGKIRVLDPTGEVRQEIAFDAKQREDGLRVAVTGRTLLEIVTDRPDGIGPAVEIEDVRIREDGRATVTVVAKDVSGLASVELFCDGRSLGEKSKAPFIWNARPSEGFHTFHGLAKDASAQRNARRSMKQTVYVGTSVPSVRLVR